jgi:hypothetical protein
MDRCAVVTLTIVAISAFVSLHSQPNKDLVANNSEMQKQMASLSKAAQEANLIAAANIEVEKASLKRESEKLEALKKSLEAKGCR